MHEEKAHKNIKGKITENPFAKIGKMCSFELFQQTEHVCTEYIWHKLQLICFGWWTWIISMVMGDKHCIILKNILII